MVNFPWFQQWNALLPDSAKTCQHYFEKKRRAEDSPRYQIGARSRCRYGASRRASGPKNRSRVTTRLCAATARHIRNFRGCENFYGLGTGVGRGLGDGAERGVGVGLGVELPVAVAVAVAVGLGLTVTVAVGVGVGVGVVAPQGVALDTGVGETVGVGPGVPTAAAMSIRPQPKTLFGGPAAPHNVEEINTAELFKASRLSWIWCRKLGIADQSSAIAPAMCGVAMDVPSMLMY